MIPKHYYIFFKKFLFSGNKTLFIFTFSLTIISSVLSGIGLGLYIPVINYFIGDNKNLNFFNLLSNKIITLLHIPGTFFSVITVATAMITLGALVTYVTMICSGYYLYNRVYRSVKMRLVNDLLNRPYHYFIHQRAGKIISIITDQATSASNNKLWIIKQPLLFCTILMKDFYFNIDLEVLNFHRII